MRRILLFLLVDFLFVGYSIGQQTPQVANTITVSSTGTAKLYHANRNEPPRAIEFQDKTVASAYFLANINQYFAIPAEFSFVEKESNTDNLGMRHRLMQQYYQGIPLEGMGYRVHEKDGFITSANGKAVRNIKLDTKISISEQQAFQLAKSYLNTKDTTTRAGRKLIVSKGFTFAPESFSIAFQFDITVSFVEKWRISIDARNGQVVNKVSLAYSCETESGPPVPYGTGTGMSNYYGSRTIRVEMLGNGSSRLQGSTENGGRIGTFDFANADILSLLWFFEWHKAYDFYSNNNTYNDLYHRPAVSVQWAAEQAYEYYFRKHNRNSYDNNGSIIKSYVHVDRNLNNAFWVNNLMAFGDGNNNNPLVELDVVTHELTHGVTEHEAGLQYYNESGALNESFSDIFGKAAEFDVFGDTATWQLARYNRDGGIRDLSDPNRRNHPDTYAGDMWYTGSEDAGGVHTNSGVQNFWFYLLCEGGTGVNDHQLAYSINAIGMDAAEKIAYRNLTEYLTYSSDYLDSRIGSMLATADLYGRNSAVYQEVDKAWDAVGVTDEPVITSFELYDITATTAKIRGDLLPRGSSTVYHFEYGTTPALGISTSTYQYIDKVEGIITGLQSQTKYYVRLVATNENGPSYASAEFTTLSLAPLVKIIETVDVTETTATLYGEINPNSLMTSFHFEYGTTPALGMVTPTIALSDATEYIRVSAAVTGLQPRQTYYYRVVAANSFSSVPSNQASLFTAVKPIITSFSPTTAPIGTEVTIIGQNFSAQPAKNLVSFGATRATVVSSTPTQIKVKVPAGASFGPISLLDAESGLTAESVQEFVPTFTGEFKKNSLQLRVGNTDFIWETRVNDMDGDNKPDIIARHSQGFSVFLNVNQGGDLTDDSFIRSTFNSAVSPSSLAVIDFDGNGLKDVAGHYENGLRIYPNFSVPGYIFFGAPIDLPISRPLSELVFADFDMDGHIDIAGSKSLGFENVQIVILRNQNPKGSFSAENFVPYIVKNVAYNVYTLTSGDINNDGSPDLLIGAGHRNYLAMHLNNSRPGAFDFDEITAEDNVRGSYVRYNAADLNQDGWKDVVSHSMYDNDNVAIRENNGTLPSVTLTTPAVVLSNNNESVVLPGDINGDGKVDLVVGTEQRDFLLLENKAGADATLTASSVENFGRWGMSTPDGHYVDTRMSINDLNGDGRPEVIASYVYYYGPHDGYQMEIWQNSPSDCVDPSLIRVEVSRYTATVKLPLNTTFDQFDIDYAPAGTNYWMKVYSSTLTNLYPGETYVLRARAKCYLSFSSYSYINFTTECVNTNSFQITSVGIDHVVLAANDLPSFEVQYSLAGKNEWQTVFQYSNEITNLLPGTRYDLRYRGRCAVIADFKNIQFTTQCPSIGSITVADVRYNRAEVSSHSNFFGDVILEYSVDNVNWKIVGETRILYPLTSGTQYFLRGRMICPDQDSDFVYSSFTTPCRMLSLLFVDEISPYSARANWAEEEDGDGYIVTYSMTGGSPTTIETTETSLLLDGLAPGTEYIVSVAPQCASTKNFTRTMFTTVCYVPYELQADAITHTTAELSWKDAIGGLPYTVEYSMIGSNLWQTIETPSTTLSISDLRPGTAYEARVHITCTSVTAPYVSLRFDTELYDETTFHPNPTTGIVTIRPSKNLIGNHFVLCDNTGRILLDGELSDYTMDLSNFSAGVHILKIDGEVPIKIVKH